MTSKVSVVSTIARLSLGVTYAAIFEKGKHRPEDRYRDELEGVWRAENQMEWYLRKVRPMHPYLDTEAPGAIVRLIGLAQGDNVSKAQPKQKSFYQAYGKEKEFTKSHIDTIYQCDEDVPPSRLTKAVKPLCSITCDLDIPYHALEDLDGANGRKLKMFCYEIEMIPSGASNEFSILYKDVKLASQDARIEFE